MFLEADTMQMNKEEYLENVKKDDSNATLPSKGEFNLGFFFFRLRILFKNFMKGERFLSAVNNRVPSQK